MVKVEKRMKRRKEAKTSRLNNMSGVLYF